MGRPQKGVQPKPCACGGKHHAKGLCLRCYSSAKRVPKPRPVNGPCACGKPYYAKGMCSGCYNRELYHRKAAEQGKTSELRGEITPKINTCACGRLVTGRRMCSKCYYWQKVKPFKPVKVRVPKCKCGKPATVNSMCKACYSADYYRRRKEQRAKAYRLAHPKCSSGKRHEWSTKGRCLRCGVMKC